MGPRRRKTQELIPCACGCGALIKRYQESLKQSRDGTKTWLIYGRERRYALGHVGKTEENRRKSGERFSGANNPKWKGGVTKLRDWQKAQPEYKAWVAATHIRCKVICQLCGQPAKEPEAHHVKPVRDYPELMLDPNNGVTLCKTCHEMTFGKEYEFVEFFAARIANGVNSGEVPPGDAEDNPEPSREGNLSEGVTTRSRAYPGDLSKFIKKEVECAHCGAKMLRHPYRVKNQKRHFCSQSCKGEWQRTGYKGQGSTRITVSCAFCGAAFERQPWQVKGYNAQYCGMQCMGRAWANRRWHGGNAPTSAPRESDEIV